MATAKELTALTKPLMERYTNWRSHKASFICLPIGYYYRGLSFQSGFFDRTSVYVSHFVFPLFEPGRIHVGWGLRRPIPGIRNRRWNIHDPHFREQLIDLMDQEVASLLAPVTTGAAFLNYLPHTMRHGNWPDHGTALAYLHMGELDLARKHFHKVVTIIRNQFSQHMKPDDWMQQTLDLYDILENNPAAIPAHCEAIARHHITTRKLEKFWEPTPFIYDKDLPTINPPLARS